MVYPEVWVLLIVEGCPSNYSCTLVSHLVSVGEWSQWQSYHIHLFSYQFLWPWTILIVV